MLRSQEKPTSRAAIRDAVGLLAVAASLVFVGWELRQSNVQAKSAAFQAIGIATADYHVNRSDRVNRLYTEANYVEGVLSWTHDDRERSTNVT